MEAAGAAVTRFSVRAPDIAALPDLRDIAEIDKTIVLLAQRKIGMILSFVATMISMPVRSWRALRVAFTLCSLRPGELVRRTAYLVEAAVLVRLMKKHSVVHLHAHFGTNSAMVARLAWYLGGPPYSITVHGSEEFDRPVQLDLHGKVADAAFCVAISSFGRSQLMRWSAIEDWRKIKVVKCGVDESFIECANVTPVPDAPILCSVARLCAPKGIPLLIDAAAELRRTGVQFKLVLVGDGELRTNVERLIEENELTENISITGWASSEVVIHHLKSSRAMVLPSFAEGLPVVVMEALALGRPVIVSAIAGTPELVDQDCGWLIPAGSVSDLIGAMRAALTAPTANLDEMGRIGRDRVVTSHDATLNGKELYNIILSYHGHGDSGD